MADLTLRLVKGSPLTNAEVDANFSSLNEAISVGGEPMGHADRTQSTLSFDNGTRTVTVAPVSGSFVVWVKGTKFTFTTAQTVVIPDTTGLHYVFFNAAGVLSTRMSYFDWPNEAPTAYVAWNASTGANSFFADERHGITLDWQTHEYLHRTRGAALANGFSVGNYTIVGTGSSDADAQLDLSGGTFFDEDLQVDVVHSNTPTANTWEQDLAGPAQIPVLYRSGDGWVRDNPTNFILKAGTATPRYNTISGGVWGLTDVPNNSYSAVWVIATNNLTYPVVAIMGQGADSNAAKAEDFDWSDLNLDSFPAVEFRPLYKIIFQCSSGYTNAIKARFTKVFDIRNLVAASPAATIGSSHGGLSGLGADDHLQYVHISEVRSPSAAVKNSFLPAQAGQTGKFLVTDGTNPSWATMTAPNNGALTLSVSGTGLSGSASFTADQAGNSTFTVTSNATSASTADAIVARDGSGNFSANVITAVSFSGSASGLTGFRTINGNSILGSGDITITAGVSSFNTRTGAITLSSSDVTTALGYTPYDSSNPSGYTSNVGTVVGVTAGTGLTGGTVTSSGTIALATSGVTAGTYTKLTVDVYGRATSGALLSSGDVTTALGFTPYNSTNPSGYITSSALSSYLPLSGGTLTGAYLDFSNSSPSLRITSGPGTFFIGDDDIVNLGSGAVVATPSSRISSGVSILSTHAYATGQGDNKTHFGYYNGTSYVNYIRGAATYFDSGTLQIGGNQALHAGNYNSYSPTLTGTGASGSWGISITGNAATVTNGLVSTGSYADPSWITSLASSKLTGTIDNARLNGGTYTINVTGNAGTATTLQTARTINGVSFNGSANITVADSTKLPLTGGTLSGVLTINSTSDNQLLLQSTDSWTGIGFNDSAPLATDYIWHNGTNGTFALGGGGANVAGKKLHVHGGMTVGANYAATTNPTNGLNVEGAIQQAGNQVLHAGNYTSYSPSLSGNYKNIGVGGLYSRYNYNESAWITDATSAFTLSPDFGTTTVAMHNGHGHFGDWATTLTMSGYERYGAYQISGWYNATTPQLAIRNYNQSLAGWTSWTRLLSAANFSSYALPLSGGTLSGSIYAPNFISTANNNYGIFSTNAYFDTVNGRGSDPLELNYHDGGPVKIGSGTNGSKSLYAVGIYDNGNQVLHAGNFSSYATARTSAGRPGVTKLYRNESDDPYNVQTTWSADASGFWSLRGFYNDNYHAACYVALSGRSNRANGNFYIDDNYGCGIVGAYASTRYQGVFAMGDSYKLPADGTSTGSLYGIAWAHPNTGGVGGNLDSHGLLVLINGGFGSCMSYSIKASGNVTAYSDERLKTNWRDMPENFVARLAQVKVGIYDRVDGERITQVGVSAQSFQQLLPQAIMTAKDEMSTLSVSYGNAALASAVELAKDNVELRARIERLEALVEKLIGD